MLTEAERLIRKDLGSIFRSMRPVLLHFPFVGTFDISGYTTVYTVHDYHNHHGGVTFYTDGRMKPVVTWRYSRRNMTLSWATLLHEFGHLHGDQPAYTRDREAYDGEFDSPELMDHSEVLDNEFRAWDWVMLNWDLAPIRTRFPYTFMFYCVDSYFALYDPYNPVGNDYFINSFLEEEGQRKSIETDGD